MERLFNCDADETRHSLPSAFTNVKTNRTPRKRTTDEAREKADILLGLFRRGGMQG